MWVLRRKNIIFIYTAPRVFFLFKITYKKYNEIFVGFLFSHFSFIKWDKVRISALFHIVIWGDIWRVEMNYILRLSAKMID